MATAVRIAQGTFYTACLAGGLSLWLWAPWESWSAPQSDRLGDWGGTRATPAHWQVDEVRESARRDVFGVVQDAHGLPIEGVRVELRTPFDSELVHAVPARWVPESVGADSEVEPAATARSTTRSALRRYSGLADADDLDSYAMAITNARGEFRLPDVPQLEGGLLHYGSELFEGDPLIRPAEPGDEPQVLVLPERPAATPLVKVAVVDRASGEPLEIDHLLLSLLRLPTLPVLDPSGSGRPLPRRALRTPQPEQLRQGVGWAELELWPGSWRLELASKRSRAAAVEFDVPPSGDALEFEVELDVFSADDGWELLAPVVDGQLELQPETSNGFREYAPGALPNRPLGEIQPNQVFRHTLRFEPGEFAEAHLELELQAGSSMSYNDSLGLEFGIPPAFGFHQHLSAMVGEWRVPMHQRVAVDLSDAIGFQGRVDLLDELADGQLDIYVQDDTGVHDVRLFLRRK